MMFLALKFPQKFFANFFNFTKLCKIKASKNFLLAHSKNFKHKCLCEMVLFRFFHVFLKKPQNINCSYGPIF